MENDSFPLSFGCQTSSSNGFFDIIEKSANGIMGLSTAATSFINQMYRSGNIKSSSFSLCFHRYKERSLDNAGTLTLGGYKADFLTSPMVYMENTGIDGKYSTVISNIYLREGGGNSTVPDQTNQKVVKLVFDKDAANSGPGTVIDTTYPGTLLNFEVGDSFNTEWYEMTGQPYSYNLLSLTEEALLRLPTILVQLKTSFSDNQFADAKKTAGMVGDLDPVRT